MSSVINCGVYIHGKLHLMKIAQIQLLRNKKPGIYRNQINIYLVNQVKLIKDNHAVTRNAVRSRIDDK